MAVGVRGFSGPLSEALLRCDVPDVSDRELAAAAAFTAERLCAAPGLTRAGMEAVVAVLATQVWIVDRVAFATLPAARRGVWVRRWSRARVPGVREYLDAVTGLALTWLYEDRQGRRV
jgi:hypothetical protein